MATYQELTALASGGDRLRQQIKMAIAQRVGTRVEVLFSAVAGAANVSTKYGQLLTADDVQKAMLS